MESAIASGCADPALGAVCCARAILPVSKISDRPRLHAQNLPTRLLACATVTSLEIKPGRVLLQWTAKRACCRLRFQSASIHVMDAGFGPPACPASIFFPAKEEPSFGSKVRGIVNLNVVPASEVRSTDMSP